MLGVTSGENGSNTDAAGNGSRSSATEVRDEMAAAADGEATSDADLPRSCEPNCRQHGGRGFLFNRFRKSEIGAVAVLN